MTNGWRGAAVAVLAALCACAGEIRLSSARSSGYPGRLGQTLLLVDTGGAPAPVGDAVKAGLVAALEVRGVRARCGDIAADRARLVPSLLDQARAAEASSVLVLLPGDQGRTLFPFRNYDGELFDVATRTVVWRATVTWNPGWERRSPAARAAVLTDELVAALVADGMLR